MYVCLFFGRTAASDKHVKLEKLAEIIMTNINAMTERFVEGRYEYLFVESCLQAKTWTPFARYYHAMVFVRISKQLAT